VKESEKEEELSKVDVKEGVVVRLEEELTTNV
jgi:hypothetical protein